MQCAHTPKSPVKYCLSNSSLTLQPCRLFIHSDSHTHSAAIGAKMKNGGDLGSQTCTLVSRVLQMIVCHRRRRGQTKQGQHYPAGVEASPQCKYASTVGAASRSRSPVVAGPSCAPRKRIETSEALSSSKTRRRTMSVQPSSASRWLPMRGATLPISVSLAARNHTSQVSPGRCCSRLRTTVPSRTPSGVAAGAAVGVRRATAKLKTMEI